LRGTPARARSARQAEPARRPLEARLHRHVGQPHIAGDPPEQRAAKCDHCRVAVHQLEHELAAPDDDRDADQDPEHDQAEIALGSARHRDHVVEAHDPVGNDDRPDRAGEGGRALDVAVRAPLVLGEQ
jgi:hypothetical protein